MGVTLYCLFFGKVPFERTGVLELYEAIREDGLELDRDCPANLEDLLHGLLEKDPKKRIQMAELRVSAHYSSPYSGRGQHLEVVFLHCAYHWWRC